MRDWSAALADWLPRQRWFQGKARELRDARVDETARLGDGVLDLFVDVRYASGPPERYQVPALDRPELVDATADPQACRLLAELAVSKASTPTSRGARVEGYPVEGHPAGSEASDAWAGCLAAPRRLDGASSNTSVVFGQRAILKLFRLLERGINPDVEVTRALTAAGFVPVPRQYGAVRLDRDDGTTTALAVLSQFIAGAVDGFEAARAEAGRTRSQRPVLDAISELGVVTAELHEALREAFGVAASSGAEPAARAGRMRQRAEQTLALAAARAPEAAARLDGRAIASGLDALAAAGSLSPLIRIHGDLHLGQVLLAGDDASQRLWYVLDFEGEPARPLAERRLPSSPLQDVAGMLRSFDYAAGAHPSATAAVWRDLARQRYLDAYLAKAHAAGLLPADPEGVLAAFELDKAVYELGYELRYRPDWIDLPLEGIARLLASRR